MLQWFWGGESVPLEANYYLGRQAYTPNTVILHMQAKVSLLRVLILMKPPPPEVLNTHRIKHFTTVL